MSTDLDKPVEGAVVPALSPEEQALVGAVTADIDPSKLVLPAIKNTQALTTEVTEGEVAAGHWFNSLTKVDYGTEIEFVICALFHGRFYRDKESGQSYAAQGDIAPSYWPEQYAGQAFTDLDDAEERFIEQVNNEEREWGGGAPIATTYNFVGLVVGDESPLPGRLSLKKGDSKVAQKIETLILHTLRAPWDKPFVFKSVKAMSSRNEPYYSADAHVAGGYTPQELRQSAVSVATSFEAAQRAGAIQQVGDEDAEPGSGARKRAAAKKKESGIGVG